MKVKDLDIGMLLEPAGDSEGFLIVKYPFSNGQFPYVTVRIKGSLTVMQGIPRQVMYLGRRKDVNIEKSEMTWSDRFVMIGSTIAAVDPSSWRRMKPVFEAV